MSLPKMSIFQSGKVANRKDVPVVRLDHVEALIRNAVVMAEYVVEKIGCRWAGPIPEPTEG